MFRFFIRDDRPADALRFDQAFRLFLRAGGAEDEADVRAARIGQALIQRL